MNNKFMQAVSLIVAIVVALGGAGGTIAVVAHYVTSLETKVAGVEGSVSVLATKQDTANRDLAEIKAQLDTIAPRRVPMSREPAQTVTVEPKTPPSDPNDDTATWPARYLADHCRRCPSCCVTTAAVVP